MSSFAQSSNILTSNIWLLATICDVDQISQHGEKSFKRSNSIVHRKRHDDLVRLIFVSELVLPSRRFSRLDHPLKLGEQGGRKIEEVFREMPLIMCRVSCHIIGEIRDEFLAGFGDTVSNELRELVCALYVVDGCRFFVLCEHEFEGWRVGFRIKVQGNCSHCGTGIAVRKQQPEKL